MHPDSEDAYTAKAVRCHACAEQARAAKTFSDQHGDPEGVYFGVSRG